ncbi:MAG: CoA transferase [Dehalococcoidia bacterium]|nr:CoA transferase [Dehalococcoidia bacterium]
MAQLFDGLKVLELAGHVAGPFAGKLFADYGADVIKVEPPEGDRSRHEGPYKDDIPDPETSALFLHLNTNKKSITLDVNTEEGRGILRRLIDQSDIVVEDFRPGQMADWGLSYDELAKDHPDLVLASITPFGQTGPWRDYRGSEITLQALGGPLHLNGSSLREPLKSGGYVAQYHCGVAVAYACVAARFRVAMGGKGDHIDQAIYEAQAGFRDRRTVYATGYQYTGYVAKRQPPGSRIAMGPRPTADGYVNIYAGGTKHFLPALDLIGRGDLKEHEDAEKPLQLYSEDFAAEVEGSWMAWLIQRDKREAVAETQQIGLLGGAIFTTEDLITDEHYRSRGVWDQVTHPKAGTYEGPGRPLIMSETPRQAPRHAPLLGEHNTEVYGALGLADDLERLRSQGVI